MNRSQSLIQRHTASQAANGCICCVSNGDGAFASAMAQFVQTNPRQSKTKSQLQKVLGHSATFVLRRSQRHGAERRRTKGGSPKIDVKPSAKRIRTRTEKWDFSRNSLEKKPPAAQLFNPSAKELSWSRHSTNITMDERCYGKPNLGLFICIYRYISYYCFEML